MDIIDINIVKENHAVKFITPNKTLINGLIRKVSKDYLGVTINTKQESFMMLHKGQSIELILVHERQALKCTSTILGSTQNDFEQAVVISIPKVIFSIDRREFQRFPIVMDMGYSILPQDTHYKDLNSVESKYFRTFKKTYTVNISAGGIYFIVSKDEIDSKFVLVSLSLKNENIVTLCEKVRVDEADDSKHNKVAYKYNDIKAQHRQLILDFVSEKSKEMSNS